MPVWIGGHGLGSDGRERPGPTGFTGRLPDQGDQTGWVGGAAGVGELEQGRKSACSMQSY